MHATLSPLGLYEYDNTVFDGWEMPDGVDRDAVIDLVLSETMGMEVNFPNADLMKRLVSSWSKLNIDRWTRILETYNYSYDPFENYDMTITETRTRTPNLTQDSTNSGTDTSDSFVKGFDDASGLVQNGQAKATLGTKNVITNTGNETEEFTRTERGDASVRAVPEVIELMRRERLGNFVEDVLIPDFISKFCNCCYSL